MTNRIYINITSKCNYECPFCCMTSSPERKDEMNFKTFMEIVDSHCNETLEVQIEGGEPTIHPDFFLFMEYVFSVPNVSRVILDTNGTNIEDVLTDLVRMVKRHDKQLTIKVSDNAYIRSKRPATPLTYMSLISALEFVDNVEMLVNLRAYTPEQLNELLLSYKTSTKDFTTYINAFILNRYGRAKNDKRLCDIVINKTVNQFFCYSSDGKCFDEDLYARALHEEQLSNKQ